MIQKIHGRSTKASVIPNEDAFAFVLKNHRKSYIRSAVAIISVGLEHQGELVAVAQFCRPRTSGKKRLYTTELLRMAFKENTRVAGGASKLVNYYRERFKPADIFTYQDMGGEQTNVYAKCDFSLAKQSNKKKYLVAPGKTITTASRANKEIVSMAYASRLGPDILLKTSIGEVFHASGKRKTNPEIFVEELGWHEEETAGDRVWEWFNPDVTFYTYKITASDSDKYYYGVTHVKKAHATKNECLNDHYFGSGGVKYKNWKKKHQFFLHKEVIETFERKSVAFQAEKKLVGQLHKEDPLCLNSTSGGRTDAGFNVQEQISEIMHCDTHGETSHVRGFCKKCGVATRTTMRECPTHGLTKHQGASCYGCIQDRMNEKKVCPVHGEANFMGKTCRNCIADGAFGEKTCPIHGQTPFHGQTCVKCHLSERNQTKTCPKHGETKFQGKSCYACQVEKRTKMGVCAIHGEVKFTGKSCYPCTIAKRYQERECPVHGLTKFSGSTCGKCSAAKAFSVKDCPVHGQANHRGTKCQLCRKAARVEARLLAQTQ